MPDQEKLYFLTILLTDKYLQSALVFDNGQGVQIKEFSEIKNYFDRQDLLDQLDKSLQQLGPDSQDVVKTIFAFDHDWLENGDLTDIKKPIVKEISEELSLDAVGQFSIEEALAEARFIGDQSDSCLLVICKEDSFDLIFLKHGQFLDLITVGRSSNVIDDFNELLARAAKHLDQDGKYFPSKVLITSLALKQKELTLLHEELMQVDWAANPGFSQAPNIVVLDQDYMIKSVSLSAGKILGKESLLAKMPQLAISNVPYKTVSEPQNLSRDSAPDYAVETPQAKVASASSFGINFDQNYFTKKENQDVGSEPDTFARQGNASSVSTSDKPSIHQEQSVLRPHSGHSFAKLSQKRSLFGRFYLSHQKMILLGVAIGLLTLLLMFSGFAIFLSKVKVVLTPEQTLLQKSVAITLDPSLQESDFDKALLKATLQNKEISGQDVTTTTGIGLVGDKAKGKVVVYNKTAEEALLKAGSIVSNNGIEFLLDSDIKIPAAVEKQGGSGVDYGKAEVSVTAKDIGSEANFNKETKFRVADYFEDKFSATSMDNFSGGSSREVRVVAEVDKSRLLDALSKKLMEEATKELEKESKDGIYLVPTGKNKTLESKFSAELGVETESLSLDLNLEVEVVKYLASDLKQLSLALLKEDLPSGYAMMSEEPSLLSDKAQVASDSSKIKLSAEMSVKAMAELNLMELKSTILAKDVIEAQSLLEGNEKIKEAKVVFNPPFLRNVIKKLPNDEKRIILELAK